MNADHEASSQRTVASAASPHCVISSAGALGLQALLKSFNLCSMDEKENTLQRIIGRLLISLAVIATAVIPIRSDWNASHVFGPQWSPHARIHGIVSIGMPVLLSPVALWLLGKRSADPSAAATMAALIPMAYCGPFFVAPFAPGASIVDPGHQLRRVAGVPLPLFGAAATILVAGLGWYVDHRGRVVSRGITKAVL